MIIRIIKNNNELHQRHIYVQQILQSGICVEVGLKNRVSESIFQ